MKIRNSAMVGILGGSGSNLTLLQVKCKIAEKKGVRKQDKVQELNLCRTHDRENNGTNHGHITSENACHGIDAHELSEVISGFPNSHLQEESNLASAKCTCGCLIQ